MVMNDTWENYLFFDGETEQSVFGAMNECWMIVKIPFLAYSKKEDSFGHLSAANEKVQP